MKAREDVPPAISSCMRYYPDTDRVLVVDLGTHRVVSSCLHWQSAKNYMRWHHPSPGSEFMIWENNVPWEMAAKLYNLAKEITP